MKKKKTNSIFKAKVKRTFNVSGENFRDIFHKKKKKKKKNERT